MFEAHLPLHSADNCPENCAVCLTLSACPLCSPDSGGVGLACQSCIDLEIKHDLEEEAFERFFWRRINS